MTNIVPYTFFDFLGIRGIGERFRDQGQFQSKNDETSVHLISMKTINKDISNKISGTRCISDVRDVFEMHEYG